MGGYVPVGSQPAPKYEPRGMIDALLDRGKTITTDAESDLLFFEMGHIGGHELHEESIALAWRMWFRSLKK